MSGKRAIWLRRGLDAATFGVLVFAIGAYLQTKQERAGRSSGVTQGMPAESVLPPISAIDSGRTHRTLFDSRNTPTLVFVFRSDCPACEAQKPTWLELARLADSLHVPVVAVSGELGAAASFSYFADPRIPVFTLENPTMIATAFGTRVVPTTIVVDGQHRMRFHHRGLLGRTERRAIRGLLARVSRTQ